MINEQIQLRTGIHQRSIDKVLGLLDEGATVPFIARYRKERTGSLDEVQVLMIQKEQERLKKLDKRKETILSAIADQNKLTPRLQSIISNCWDPVLLEDIYLPYKKSRKTKGDVARDNGLEPLAQFIFDQRNASLQKEAKKYVTRNVLSVEAALGGARHIIAEWINENSRARDIVRQQYNRYAQIECKVVTKKKAEAEKYKDYFQYQEPLKRCPSHRLLAVYRGDAEGLLKMKITIDEDRAFEKLARHHIKYRDETSIQIELAIRDSLKRLLLPSIQNECKKTAKEKADHEAISVFANNLRQLLLASPLGTKRVLALDPGFRTGCKMVALDESGNMLDHRAIYPHPPQNNAKEAANLVSRWISTYHLEHIAIGNGTAGRETYQWLSQVNLPVDLYMVNESGASIYSASQVAREEFPDVDLTVRGAVSIGRRLMDPLAELVKIDAKSIGVGQYQHDVNQAQLKESLDQTVVSCVNAVGINLNTASKHLLQYVAGIGPTLANNIVQYRQQHGQFQSRQQLLEVPRMGQKAFEQAVGFLRIGDGPEPLDNTGVHPERYRLVRRMLKANGISATSMTPAGLQSISLASYVDDEVGMPTLTDIIAELSKPGLDPRGQISPVQFSSSVKSMSDLSTGMVLTGIVNNLTKFGAFVDIGIKESGLIHISQIVDRYIKDPAEVLSLSQEVTVKVIDIDIDRKRISLTMKEM